MNTASFKKLPVWKPPVKFITIYCDGCGEVYPNQLESRFIEYETKPEIREGWTCFNCRSHVFVRTRANRNITSTTS